MCEKDITLWEGIASQLTILYAYTIQQSKFVIVVD